MLSPILIAAGIITNVAAIIILTKDLIPGYGSTMGGMMMYTHLSVIGSLLISLGIGMTGHLHWILCIFTGFLLFILMYVLRIVIENRKKIRKK